MTDAPKDGDNELVLDWDDAVESFRLDLESNARAESEPFPQRARTEPLPKRPSAPLSGPEAPRPSAPENERPTLPPQASLPPPHDPLSLSVFESVPPMPEPRLRPRPVRRPSAPDGVSTTPPALAPPSPFGRTLAGLAPVAQRPSTPNGGGLFVQQRATLRPDAVSTKPPAPLAAPSEQEPTRPGGSEPSQEESAADASARPRTTSPSPREPLFNLEDDDDSDATQVAAVPRELLDALLAGTANMQTSNNRETERPPAPPSDELEGAPLRDDGELELSGLAAALEGEEEEQTEIAEIELVAPKEEPPAERTGLRAAPPPYVPPRGLPPAPPQIARLSTPNLTPRASKAPEPAAPSPDAVLSDLDELLPPVAVPVSEKPPAPAKTARADFGAKAARDTVGASKPRVELAGATMLDESGKRARIALLEALAKVKDGPAKAELLVSAAELSEEIRDADGAKERYTRAHEAAPKLLTPIWALARFAFEAREIDDHLAWLARAVEAADSSAVRARALALSARVHWLVQRELPAALRAVTEAARLCPDNVDYRVLEARLTLATRAAEAETSLSGLAETLPEEGLAPAFWLFSGAALEARGEPERAREAYHRAARGERDAGPALALARLHRARGERASAGSALALAAHTLGGGIVGQALRRHAAALLGEDAEQRAQALSLLQQPNDAVSARTALALAAGSAEGSASETAAAARRAWIEHTDGQERALAWVCEAEYRMQNRQHAEAAEALEQALSLDRGLSLSRVLWESLARESGSLPTYLQRAASDSPVAALRAAAKLACEPSGANAEIELLAHIEGEREATIARTLRLDARAEAGQLETVLDELRPEAESAPNAAQLLLLADVARRARGEDESRAILQRAADLFPDETQVTRAWARHAENGVDTVRALLLEAGGARGARAAFLQLLAGQSSADPTRRLEAFERAYEALPSYAPAVFALHAETRRQNELSRLANLHTREATRAKDPFTVVSHLLRAALVRAHDDGDAAAAQLTRALDLAPSDPVLRELVIRLGDAVPASLRAEAMQRIAERASPPFDRAATLAAAGAFEDAGQAERALALYEAVLRSHPEDPISEMGRERVARAAGRARELLEAKRRAIHEASTDAGRVRALEDLLQADTDAPAEESLDRARALLVLSPTHPLALRRAERHAMDRNDTGALMDTELRLLQSSSGAKDKLARLRLVSLLTSLKRGERARADELDQLFVAHAASTYGGPWLSRQLMGAGVALGQPEVVLAALDLFAQETEDPVELVSLAVRRARLDLPKPPPDRESKLEQALAGYPDHPTALEAQAELALARGAKAQAAALFGQAAEHALSPSRVARLWAQAGKLYEDLQQIDAAKAAYTKAVEADIGFEDVEARLRALFKEESDLEGMIRLIQARLAKGVAADQGVKLRQHLAELHERRGNPSLAAVTLRDALELAPEDLGILRELVRLLSGEKDPRERAQLLLRIARLSREPVELRDVFMKLGEIYDRELPDPRRAEAAYQRALKLGPRHAPALERLASLYEREGQTEQAESCLAKLVALADTPEKRLAATLELSRSQEARADTRAAEETLEALRREQPVDHGILRALIDFYRRHGALSALAMHLNRAAADLRHEVERDVRNTDAWLSLVQVLDEKHRPDAARVSAAAALACGIQHERLRGYVDADSEVPGVAGAAFSELLDDLVFGEDMPPSTRIVFRYGAEALNKSAPFDLRAVGGERLDKRHPLRAVVAEVARWAGAGDVEVFTSAQLPLAFVPVSDSPAQILVGQALLEGLNKKEQVFLTSRALKIARAHMSITCRVRPEEMGLLLHGLIRSQMPGYTPEGPDLAAVDEMTRRVTKHLNKRTLPELIPHLMELMGAPHFDPARVYAVASTAGNRAGLLAAGSPSAALSALAKLAGLKVSSSGVDRTLLENVEEARDLLSFAISEAHFEARLRAGVDLR